MATYIALIDEEIPGNWLWAGESPYYNKEGAPMFNGDDQLYLRLWGTRGTHKITLTPPEGHLPPMPFKAPHDKLEFDYDSSKPLEFVIKLLGQTTPWSFTLEKDGVSVDPEFQVGTGTGLPD